MPQKWGRGTGKPPEFPGRFIGQCVRRVYKAPTGKRFPTDGIPHYRDEGRYPDVPVGFEVRRFKVVESREDFPWVWDGEFWVDMFTWERRHPSAGKVLVSKHDHDLPSHDSPAKRLAKRATLPTPPSRRRSKK